VVSKLIDFITLPAAQPDDEKCRYRCVSLLSLSLSRRRKPNQIATFTFKMLCTIKNLSVLPNAKDLNAILPRRYPHVAADLLAADVPEVTSMLYNPDTKLIDRIYDLIQQDKPDNLLTIHCCRVLSAMFATNTRLVHNCGYFIF